MAGSRPDAHREQQSEADRGKVEKAVVDKIPLRKDAQVEERQQGDNNPDGRKSRVSGMPPPGHKAGEHRQKRDRRKQEIDRTGGRDILGFIEDRQARRPQEQAEVSP